MSTSRGRLVRPRFIIPEIADYEVRRALIRAKAENGLRRLDSLRRDHVFQRISESAMLMAAELWADVRRRGLPTADDSRLDADAIVAAQAMDSVGLADSLTVATENVGHLVRFFDEQRSQFLEAKTWREITS